MDARGGAYHRGRWTAQLLACLIGPAMIPLKKVRFYEPHRPPQVRWGAIGVIVDMEERGTETRVRARFGDFMSP
jgi:hypothetical protein